MKPLLSKEEIADLLTPLGTELDAGAQPGAIEKIHIEAGRVALSEADLLQLRQGTILKTDKTVDAPFELYIRNTLIGRAERIQIEGKLAFKITELSPTDR